MRSSGDRIGRRLAGNRTRHRHCGGQGIEAIERNARRRERRHQLSKPRQEARIDNGVSMPIVLCILTDGREILCRLTTMVRFSRMFVLLVVGVPVPKRQCGCTERHHQAGEERAKSADGALEHLTQN